MKKLITTILLIISFNSFSQERIGSFKNDVKKNTSFIKEILPIVNSQNNDIGVFFSDSKSVYGYKLNNKFEVVEKIISEDKRSKYRTLLGYSIIGDDNYNLIFTNQNEKKFLLVNFSFDNKSSSTKEFELESPKERIVQAISHNNKFHLITIIPFNSYVDYTGKRKSESQINFNDDVFIVYTIGDNKEIIRNQINLAQHKFSDKNNDRIKIKSLVYKKDFRSVKRAQKIDSDVKNSIEVVSKTEKIYVKNDSLIFSFDKNNNYTQLLNISLKNYETNSSFFKKNMTDALKSNSFISDDKIFIASVNKNELEFNVYNLNSKKLLKKLFIKKEENISFKNTPIKIYVNESEGSARETEDTKKYLRKITANRFGVAALKNNNQYLLSLGGYKLQTFQPYSGGMGFGGMPVAGFGNATMFFNPTMFAYNSGSVSKSTKIECLFDENLNHIEGEIPKTSFDNIDTYLSRNNDFEWDDENESDNIEGIIETENNDQKTDTDDNDFYDIFRHKENIILGSYDKSTKMYYFYKF